MAVLLPVGLGVFGFAASLLYTRQRAACFLAEVQQLKPGDSTTTDVERLLREYGGYSMKRSSDSPCSGPNCIFYSVELYNRPMEYLLRARWAILHPHKFRAYSWRAPNWWRVLAVGVYVDNGRVVYIELRLRSRKEDESVVEGSTQEVQRIPEGLEFRAFREGYCLSRPMITGGDGGGRIRAMIDLRASPMDRERAFDMNLRCMSTLSGCTELSEIMPSVYKDLQEYLRQHTQPPIP